VYTCTHSVTKTDPDFHFDTDPDPDLTFHFKADQNPDPTHFVSLHISAFFDADLDRDRMIRRFLKMTRIYAGPDTDRDPQH
jgi:hypothetical protein